MRIASFFLLLVLCGLLSCTKEKSFEVGAPATGSLKSSATGECLPKIASGSFIAGTRLTDSNYLIVELDIKTPGSYAIRTDTVNGYSFKGSGNFTKTGLNRITLAGSGTPITAGTDEFSVLYDTSFCLASVTVLPAGSNSGPAAFTLLGSGDSCMIAGVNGQYKQGTALGGSNTVSMKVNVTTPGTYTIATNTVNGFQFSGSGTLPATGEQTLTLPALGTPTAAGTFGFSISAGSTTCSFAVKVDSSGGTPPGNASGDLFPLSANSWWSYVLEEGETEDTLTIRNVGTAVFNQKTYNRFKFDGSNDPEDEANYRKQGNDYFEYGDVTKYSLIEFDAEQKGDILFLKENLKANDTWQSASYTGAINGSAVTLRYTFTCTAVNASETVNGQPFSGITKIEFKAEAGTGGFFTDAGPVITLYFAKGIGLIQQTADGIPDYTLYIKNYSVK